MKHLFLSAGAVALTVGTAAASDRGTFGASELHLDALELHLDALENVTTQELHLDALGMESSELHLDALELHLDALGHRTSELHLDALELHLDALGFARNELHLDALGLGANELHLDALELHLDALGVQRNELHLDALELHLDALAAGVLAGNDTVLSGGANAFWGSFRPQELHLDALGLTPDELHLDALELHLDALAGFDADELHLDALELHLDALNSFDPDELHLDALELHLDALSAFDPSELHLDALELHLDALGNLEADELHLDALELHLDALASYDSSELHLDALELHLDALGGLTPDELHLDALELHLDALGTIDPSELHLDALELHLDALNVSPLELHLDALELHLDALELHLDALGDLQGMELHLDALQSSLDALASIGQKELHLDALELHLDALDYSELELHLDALADLSTLAENLSALELHLDALDMNQLELHLDALAYEQLELHLDALGGLGELSLHLDALGQTASALGNAWDGYQGLLDSAESAFGDLVRTQTGTSFVDGFLTDFLAKHNLSGSGFGDFVRMDRNERTAFLIDLSDQLTTFLGIDHPDHWMSTVTWSPLLSEIAGYGNGVTIGVVDQGFEGAGGLGETPLSFGPIHAGQTHGLAVSGVAAGALDSRGVMGVAPKANVVLGNPFAANGEAAISDVTRAITDVARSGASVINLSLGEAGYSFSEGWLEAFNDPALRSATGDALFVMASGNDGVVQEMDVNFGGLDAVDQIIIVGALGLDGEIASFSNTPGDACFITSNACTPMKERFLVAPGQQILVTTEDGVGRTSGTSFAAPMVSGAAALLQSRWGWLADDPEATAEILFRSADDIGEEGVDDVYGWGLLNVAASQSPLDVSALTFRGQNGPVTINGAGLTPQLMRRVDQRSSITVFETVAGTFRDFEIPVGAFQTGVFDPAASLEEDAELYFAGRLGRAGAQTFAGLSFDGLNGFTDAAPLSSVTTGSETRGWTLTLEARQPSHGLQLVEGELGFETHGSLTSRDSGLTLDFGQGDSVLAFSSSATFSMTSDHDIQTGGVNPVLGLASGGAYFRAAMPIGERLTLSGGISSREHADLVANPFSGALTERVSGTEGYRATAANAALAYSVTDRTSVSVGVTSLREIDGFLGGQSVGALGFGETADSRAVTVGFESELGFGFGLAMSATAGRTDGGRNTGGLLAIGDEGVTTTAYQAALTKTGLIGKDDILRLSFAQPLHIEEGTLEASTLDVVDRSTGELGFVADTIGLTGGDRRYVSEVIYGRPVLDGRASVAAFAQVDTSPLLNPGEPATTGGLRFSIRY